MIDLFWWYWRTHHPERSLIFSWKFCSLSVFFSFQKREKLRKSFVQRPWRSSRWGRAPYWSRLVMLIIGSKASLLPFLIIFLLLLIYDGKDICVGVPKWRTDGEDCSSLSPLRNDEDVHITIRTLDDVRVLSFSAQRWIDNRKRKNV